jgi:tetratricopeptide (TPR) repeat protein
MKPIFLKLFILILFITNSYSAATACTIFMANDGQNVWIGNNEDELQNVKYRIWYYPAKKGNYGYSIWTELSFGRLLNGFSYLNPQGGLNEHGLFLDFTAIDDIEIIKDTNKKDRKKQVVTDILKKCKTVEETLIFLNKFNLIKIKSAQLFIGDATGNYATVTGGYIVRKTENSFALTNYCINKGYKEACHRRDVATQYLTATKTFQLENIKDILAQSTQKLPNNLISNYSMAVNLKTSTIYLYYKNDFTTASILSLSEEFKKGKHHKDIVDYFPKSIAPILQNELNNNGINAVINRFNQLQKNASDKYNFKNDDALNLAISWIERGQINEAIKLLECLKGFQPNKLDVYSWLGVAYKKQNNVAESDKNFAHALAQNPNNYVATLFGKQNNQKITFKLPDFEGAEQVSIMGNFTEWTKKPIKMTKEKGFWTCEILLPKGEVIYKFIVNKEYLADNKNFMHIGEGPKIYSKVYVW